MLQKMELDSQYQNCGKHFLKASNGCLEAHIEYQTSISDSRILEYEFLEAQKTNY